MFFLLLRLLPAKLLLVSVLAAAVLQFAGVPVFGTLGSLILDFLFAAWDWLLDQLIAGLKAELGL